MKKLVKVLGMAAALTALPVTFTGGAAKDGRGLKINACRADGNQCVTRTGSMCVEGPVTKWNKRMVDGDGEV